MTEGVMVECACIQKMLPLIFFLLYFSKKIIIKKFIWVPRKGTHNKKNKLNAGFYFNYQQNTKIKQVLLGVNSIREQLNNLNAFFRIQKNNIKVMPIKVRQCSFLMWAQLLFLLMIWTLETIVATVPFFP